MMYTRHLICFIYPSRCLPLCRSARHTDMSLTINNKCVTKKLAAHLYDFIVDLCVQHTWHEASSNALHMRPPRVADSTCSGSLYPLVEILNLLERREDRKGTHKMRTCAGGLTFFALWHSSIEPSLESASVSCVRRCKPVFGLCNAQELCPETPKHRSDAAARGASF